MTIIDHMDHFTVTSPDLPVTQEFYEALGLTVGTRPKFRFPGLWLYSGDKAILHVIHVKEAAKEPDGAIDHIAFWATGLAPTIEMLEARGVSTKLMRLPEPFNAWQLFFRDPFGAMVELDFDGAEVAPRSYEETTIARDAVQANA